MKKIALIVAIALLVGLVRPSKPLFYGEEGSYCFYVGSMSSSCEIITVSADRAASVKPRLREVCGESISTTNADFEKTVVARYNAEKVRHEEANGVSVDYYYSSEIPDYVTIGGTKVNIQIARRGDVLTVGSPMIFGSF